MDFGNTAATVAALAIVGTIVGAIVRSWATVKEFMASIVRLLIVELVVEDDMSAKVILSHMIKNYKTSSFRKKKFGGTFDIFRSGKYGYVPYESFTGQTVVFWKKWIPIWFIVIKQEQKDVPSWYPEKTTKSIRYIRNTVNIDKLISKSFEERNEVYWAATPDKTRFFIKTVPDPKKTAEDRFTAGTSFRWYHEGCYRLLSYKSEELGQSLTTTTNNSAIKNLFFPDHVNQMIQEVQMWCNLRTWYRERGIPWKRGWVLYGPPGTGKTAIARAIAEDLDMPLFVFSLGHLMDDELQRSWQDMQAHTPCIALFEDFDTVFKGRENVFGKSTIADVVSKLDNKGAGATAESKDGNLNIGRLNFGCVLNCLDGADKIDGIFTIITTNHIEHLDPALGLPQIIEDGSKELISTRPGRIDKAIYLGYMRNEDKLKLAERILFDSPEGLSIIRDYIDANPDKQETPAQFQERCSQLAIAMLWQAQNKCQLNQPTLLKDSSQVVTHAS